ncbi:MAG: hypothetical protein ACW98K_03530 [Candidatus Kariarchaeaceae archaeon]|jgi:rRNA-processing protein FCF1
MKTIQIFIDTNVLLHSTEMRINITSAVQRVVDGKFDILVHPLVEGELIASLKQEGKLSRNASVAMGLTTEFSSYQDTRQYSGTDQALLRSARRDQGCVLTFDKDLVERCNKMKIPVITNYKKGRFHLVGHIE